MNNSNKKQNKKTPTLRETHKLLLEELKEKAKKLLKETELIESVANKSTSITLEYLGVMHGFEYRQIELMGTYYTLLRMLMKPKT